MFTIFPRQRAVFGAYWLPFLVILALSFGLRLELYLLHPDAAWFSLAADKWLAGGRFFIDIFEINHPLVTLLHVPIVALQKLGLTFSAAAYLYFHLLVAWGFWLCLLALRCLSLADRDKNILSWGYVFLALVPAGEDLGQKEHIAVLLLTPYLFLAGSLNPRPFASGVLIAIVAALVFALKPQFLAVMGLVLLLRAGLLRSLRPADWSLELVLLVAYLAIQGMSLAAWPEFITVTRDFTLAFYNQTGKGPGLLLTGLALTGFLAPLLYWLVVSGLSRRPPWRFMQPVDGLLLAAAFGFAIAFWHQRHGILYQAYPAAMLVLLASLRMLFGSQAAAPMPKLLRQIGIFLIIANALFAGYISFAFSGVSWRAARANPETAYVLDHLRDKSVYLVSPLFEGGLPIGRIANWQWTSRYPGHWMVTLIRGVRQNSLAAGDREHVRTLDKLLAQVRRNSARDFSKSNADYLLCFVRDENDPCLIEDFLIAEPSFATAFKRYELHKKLPLLAIYRRKK